MMLKKKTPFGSYSLFGNISPASTEISIMAQRRASIVQEEMSGILTTLPSILTMYVLQVRLKLQLSNKIIKNNSRKENIQQYHQTIQKTVNLRRTMKNFWYRFN